MRLTPALFLTATLVLASTLQAVPAAAVQKEKSVSAEAAALVPAASPRSLVPAGREQAFRDYCLRGEGAVLFSRIRKDFDALFLGKDLEPEPLTYGDPSPSRRNTERAAAWRKAQGVCGRAAGIAEAASLIWLVTGEQPYLAQAKSYLLGLSDWHFAPDWKNGPVVGATDIYYNDEAHFRLWRKTPEVFDLIRNEFTPDERAKVLAHLAERGRRSAAWIEANGKISGTKRGSIEGKISSHPIRFMPMTGMAGLALWDDLPEARAWWDYAYRFYRDQFSPWGGDDGGWAEGPAYWRGTFEHAAFQDCLLSLGSPQAYASPFWRNSPYFGVYNLQPYLHTIFGDTSYNGRFLLQGITADYLRHMARVLQDGHLSAFAELCVDKERSPADSGLADLSLAYPIATEVLLRNFTASRLAAPASRPLAELPANRHFKDIGWVSFHSALGRPEKDIHLTFKSSRYGSFSHSHADQNAFILNAYGESLAINSSYREFHNSPHHEGWTRQTLSKNAILIDGVGQKSQAKEAIGHITSFSEGPRYAFARGNATPAYVAQQPSKGIESVVRDVLFVDKRYFVICDRVKLSKPATLSWLLHAEHPLSWDNAAASAGIEATKARLLVRLITPGQTMQGTITDQTTVPVDPSYQKNGEYSPQQHLRIDLGKPEKEHLVYSVLWPEPAAGSKTLPLPELDNQGWLTVRRPDGRTDRILLTTTQLEIQ